MSDVDEPQPGVNMQDDMVRSTWKIQISDLSLSYELRSGVKPVIKSLSMNIAEGELLTIVGPSGCGKSTFLNLLAGVLTANHGQILIDGKPISGPGSDRTMVFQDDAVFPWYTVRQNVEYGLRMAGMENHERQERTEHFLRLVGLEQSADMYPRELSGGMKKRVDLARALAPRPQVLLMDEPFAALDVMTKERLQKEFLDIWRGSGLTVVFVTHDLEEALFLSSRVAVMTGPLGQIHEMVATPFGWPRELRLKVTPEFQRLRFELAQTLHTM